MVHSSSSVQGSQVTASQTMEERSKDLPGRGAEQVLHQKAAQQERDSRFVMQAHTEYSQMLVQCHFQDL